MKPGSADPLVDVPFSSSGTVNRSNDAPLADRLNLVIDRALARNRVVGTAILVARDGGIVFARAAGFADRENGQPVRADTIFRLASMTKPIVSAATLALAEQGKIHLDDPVTRWLPDFRPALSNGHRPTITVRHLLTHTAGLNYGFKESPDGPYHRVQVSDGLEQPGLAIDENLRRLASVPLLYPPGNIWHYSLAIDVLGEVVARASHASLPKMIAQLVTGPLAMKDTTFSVSDATRLATAYADAEPQPVRMNDPESIELMTKNAIGALPAPSLDPGWRFGLGFAVLEDPKPTASPRNPGSWRWGGVYGNSFWVDPAACLSVVALTNTAVAGMTGDFRDSVVRAVYGI